MDQAPGMLLIAIALDDICLAFTHMHRLCDMHVYSQGEQHASHPPNMVTESHLCLLCALAQRVVRGMRA